MVIRQRQVLVGEAAVGMVGALVAHQGLMLATEAGPIANLVEG